MSSFETPTIDITDIAAKLHMPAGREYALDITSDGTPTTTGVVRTPQGHTITSTATGFESTGPWVGPVAGTLTGDVVTDSVSEATTAHGVIVDGVTCKDSGVAASGGLSVDATHGIDAAGRCGVTSIAGGANIATVPEFVIDSDGAARVISLGIGPQDGVLAGVTATGEANFVDFEVGPITTPAAGIDTLGNSSVVSLNVGPYGGTSVAAITAAGAATMLSASIGTAGSEEVTIDATGITAPAFNGDLTGDVTGNADTATTADEADAMSGALVRGTAEYRPCNMQPDDMTGTEWTRGSGSPVYSLGASQTEKILWGYVTEPEGRTLVGWKCGGGFVDADVSGSLTAQMFKYPGGVETAVGAAISVTRDGARWSCAETLDDPVVLAASTVYAIKITATTGADDSFTCDYCRSGSK